MKTKLITISLLAILSIGGLAWHTVAVAQGENRSRDKYRYPTPRVLPAPYPAQPNVAVQILIEGHPARVYYDGPYRWIEGRRGEHFAFQMTNQNPFAVGVIPSADGHSLTADGPAGPLQAAYVLAPYETATISVWRQDLRGGRALIFTEVDRSLAALKGDRRNIGVLGVLVWQLEDRHRPVPVEPGQPYRKNKGAGESSDSRARAGAGSGAAPGAESGDSSGAGAKADVAPRSGPAYREDRGIGVGAGERLSDPTYLTNRYRRVRVLGTVSLYYDDWSGLQRAGVDLSQHGRRYEPYSDRRQSNPFPQDPYQGDDYPGVRIPD